MSRTNCCSYSTLPPLPTLAMGANQFPPFTADRLFTVPEAAAYLKVGTRTLCNFITKEREHKLQASWVGRQYLITEAALKAFVKANEQEYPGHE
jgi:excisionase family DNA binding protein